MEQTIALDYYIPQLQKIAYSILQCQQDAEDIVQDTFVKWLTIDQDKINNTKAYLITAVTHNCLNHLQTLRKKKEFYLDTWQLPDFLVKVKETDFAQIDLEAEVQAALAILQTKLEPLERAVFLLRDIFNVDYDALQDIFQKEKDHCRQLFSRAKKKLDAAKTFSVTATSERTTLMESFRKACDFGFATELVQELKEEIALLQKKGKA